MKHRIAVIGAGAGAFCWAATLCRAGHEVYMGTRTREALSEVEAAGAVRVSMGEGAESCPVAGVGTPQEVVASAEIVVLCVPADRLPAYYGLLIPSLTRDHLVVLAPGNTGGALYWGREFGFRPPFGLVELNTLPFVARKTDGCTVRCLVELQTVNWAALPGLTPRHAEWAAELLPRGKRVFSVLQTALTNFNPVIHPAAMIVNAGRMESSGSFLWYSEGSGESAGRLMNQIDAERMGVQRALGLPAVSFAEFFFAAGYSPGTPFSEDIAQILRNSEANRAIKGPSNLDHRFMHEDVPFGLVPLSEIARGSGVSTEVTDSVIQISEVIMHRPYREEGFNAIRLGIEGMSRQELLAVLAG